MNRMTDQEIVAIVQAKINGADIEVKHIVDDDTEWFKPTDGAWNFINYVYRIVPPKPKMVKYYGYIDPDGFIRLVQAFHAISMNPALASKIIRAPHLDCELPE